VSGQYTDRQRSDRTLASPGTAPGARAAGPHGDRLARIAATLNAAAPVQRVANRTGMPDQLKAGVEALSGMSLDHVRVHHNSPRPAQLNAHAYAQGPDIHLAPGQGQHLPHEAWHVVQQAQGRVKPTIQMKVGQLKAGVPINDDTALEQEADMMGERALSAAPGEPVQRSGAGRVASVVQRVVDGEGEQVDIADLTEDEIGQLLNEGKSGDLTAEEGDDVALIEEFQRRRGINKKRRFTPQEEESSSDEDFTLTHQEEIVNYMTTEGRFNAGLDDIKFDKDGEEREPRPWPELSLQGTVGEYLAREKMAKTGDAIHDLNKFQLNFAGLDHLTNNKDYPFEQTKLHLSESTAKPETYLGHVKKSGIYAIKAVRALKKKHKEFREMLKDEKFKGNETLLALDKALDELDGTGDDDIDGSEAQKLVEEGMRFTIPRDIYDQIPKEARGPFLPLDETVEDIRGTMDMMGEDYVPKKPSGSKKKDEDDEFTL
jgi:hypothetical protein